MPRLRRPHDFDPPAHGAQVTAANDIRELASLADCVAHGGSSDDFLPSGPTFLASVVGYQARYRVRRIATEPCYVSDANGAPVYREVRKVLHTRSGLVWDVATGQLLSWRQDAYEVAPLRLSYMSGYAPTGAEAWAPGEK